MYRTTVPLAVAFAFSSAFLLTAAAQPAAFEHPVIRPMPGSVVSGQTRHVKFSEMAITVREGTRPVTKNVEGEYWHVTFIFKDAKGQQDRQLSIAEILRNYEAATERIGGTVHYKTGNRLSLSVPRAGGGLTWAKLYVSSVSYQLEIIDEKGPELTLVFDAAAMRNALTADGRVAIYGILFDTDQASLKPGSGSVLDEIARLLGMDATLRIEVQGHTDATGAAARNRDLSQRRAQSVVSALALYGVEASRLVAKGYGPDKPVGDNASEDGRQKNRRVELVKLP